MIKKAEVGLDKQGVNQEPYNGIWERIKVIGYIREGKIIVEVIKQFTAASFHLKYY